MILILFAHHSELVLRVVSYLSGNDTLRLLCVSRSCHRFLAQYSDKVFRIHLQADFAEGQCLALAFDRRHSSSSKPSYKELYLAFQNRWKIPTTKEKSDKYIAIPWTHPRRQSSFSENAQNEEDLNALVFIVRVWDYPDSCGFMKWEEEGSGIHKVDGLTFDDEWDDYVEPLDFPPLSSTVCRWIDSILEEFDHEKFKDIEGNMVSTFRLTLHAIDMETCQVMTLLDDSPGDEVDGVCNEFFEFIGHCDNLPKFFGLPRRGSPSYKTLTSRDFEAMARFHFEGYEDIETLDLLSSLNLGRFFEHEGDEKRPQGYDDTAYMDQMTISPYTDFSSIRDRYSLCSFFRALMKENCVEMPVRNERPLLSCKSSIDVAPLVQQPVWVKIKKILDNVLSFVPFEQQATTHRLVCKSFKASALSQLEDKLLDKTWLPLAFERYDPCSWFRADARRGWSESFNSRDSVIDDALWMVSCRCLGSCKDKGTCTGTKEAASFTIGGVTKKLDMVAARRLLTEQGHFYLTSDFPDGQKKRRRGGPSVMASFHCDSGKSLYQLCQSLHKNVKKEVQYHYLPGDLATHYGVTVEMTSKRFLRSLFLVFTNGTSFEDGHFPEISIAMAKTSIQNYHRTKTVFRFRTASQEPIEISLESKHAIF